MAETWKDVAGYEGLYQVSNLGRVRSLLHGKIWILKSLGNRRGYLRVERNRNGTRKDIYVHRLVAEAFIPNPLNLPQVNHKDEDKTNNSVDNLEWCTAKYNLNYGTCQARKSAKLKGRRRLVNWSRAKVVLQYDKSGNFVREWPSTIEVQRQTGFAQPHISDCCRGKRKSAYGYIWRFK